MKFLNWFILCAGFFICGYQNTSAQDLFTRFEKRFEAANKKSEIQSPTLKVKRKKGTARIISESTADYTLLLNENDGFPADTIPKRRLEEKINSIRSDSLLNLFQYSSSKKKGKKKSEEKFYYDDTTSTTVDSTIFNKELTDGTEMQDEDSVLIQPQVLIMDSANTYFDTNKYDSAIIYFNKIVEQFPTTEEYKLSFLWRAKAKFGLNDLDGALHDLNIFIALDNCVSKWCSESFYQRGMVHFKLQNFQDAIIDFTKVIIDTSYMNYKYCFFYRAFCLGETGNYIQAVQNYTKFLQLDKFKSVSSAEALYYRGFYKVKLDDNRGAISDYNLAIEMYSGAYESSKGKNQIYFQKLIDTYITRGLAYAEIKKWDEAVENYNTVIKMKPDYSLAYHLKGLSEIGKGDLDSGCLDLSKAGELGSNEAYIDIKIHCK